MPAKKPTVGLLADRFWLKSVSCPNANSWALILGKSLLGWAFPNQDVAGINRECCHDYGPAIASQPRFHATPSQRDQKRRPACGRAAKKWIVWVNKAPHLATAIPSRRHRLKGNAHMCLAIGFACGRRQAAEPEIFCCGVANGPFAGAFGQLHQADLFGMLFNFANRGEGLGADFICRRLWRQRLPGRHNRFTQRQRCHVVYDLRNGWVYRCRGAWRGRYRFSLCCTWRFCRS